MASHRTCICTGGCVKLPELQGPVTVVCHDAGAANLIISWLVAMPWLHAALRPVMQGPAVPLWRQAFPSLPSIEDLQVALAGSCSVLSGTGWSSKLEHEARRLAAEAGLYSIAVIDHWVNYPERFIRDGRCILPDQIWVSDAHAARIARDHFAGIPITQLPNLYLDGLSQQVCALSSHAAGDVLYLCEPARSDWGRGVPGEFQALDFFAGHAALAGIPDSVRVRLRLHPSEPEGKYDAWIAAHGPVFTLDKSASLAEAMRGARWVAGCESFAMNVALQAGRDVISVLPPWAPEFRLPQSGIRQLRTIGADA